MSWVTTYAENICLKCFNGYKFTGKVFSDNSANKLVCMKLDCRKPIRKPRRKLNSKGEVKAVAAVI